MRELFLLEGDSIKNFEAELNGDTPFIYSFLLRLTILNSLKSLLLSFEPYVSRS